MSRGRIAGVISKIQAELDAKYRVTPLDKVYRLRGQVVRGFGRGSKTLGFPTANLDPAAFKEIMIGVPRGVYAGFASVNGGPVYKTVLSLGLNPTFATTEETVEAFILNDFKQDFYGSELSLLVCGYIRPSLDFSKSASWLDELIGAIQWDVRVSTEALDRPPFSKFATDPFFTQRTAPGAFPFPSSTSDASSPSSGASAAQSASLNTGISKL